MLLNVEQFNYRRFRCTLRVLSQLDVLLNVIRSFLFLCSRNDACMHIRVERIISLDYKSYINLIY